METKRKYFCGFVFEKFFFYSLFLLILKKTQFTKSHENFTVFGSWELKCSEVEIVCKKFSCRGCFVWNAVWYLWNKITKISAQPTSSQLAIRLWKQTPTTNFIFSIKTFLHLFIYNLHNDSLPVFVLNWIKLIFHLRLRLVDEIFLISRKCNSIVELDGKGHDRECWAWRGVSSISLPQTTSVWAEQQLS